MQDGWLGASTSVVIHFLCFSIGVSFTMATRKNSSFLAFRERVLLAAIVRRLPASMTPDQLTIIGLIGAAVAALGFVLSNWSSGFLFFVILGLLLNWFGDSLDGTLARYRGIERPRHGFFIDHSSDLIAQSAIIMGLGCSPYFTLSSALFVLSLYLLISSYTYIKVATTGIHHLSYGGLGATEFRILIAAWAIFAEFAGPSFVQGRIMGFAGLDVVIGGLSACSYVFFIFMVRSDVTLAACEDEERAAPIYRFQPKAREPSDLNSVDSDTGVLHEPIQLESIQQSGH
jgi:archaetidylinositol phosphate synthase